MDKRQRVGNAQVALGSYEMMHSLFKPVFSSARIVYPNQLQHSESEVLAKVAHCRARQYGGARDASHDPIDL
jgi:hypothetical protein